MKKKPLSRWCVYDYEDIDMPQYEFGPGCYVVFYKKEALYVGSTKFIRKRIKSDHKIDYARYSNRVITPWIDSTHGIIIKVKYSRKYGEELKLENRLIRKLKPKYNKRGK